MPRKQIGSSSPVKKSCRSCSAPTLGLNCPGRWLEPGTSTFAAFFPELHEEYEVGRDQDMVRRLMDRRLQWIVKPLACKYGRPDPQSVEDLIQDLKIRVAEMDAASRYDPRRGTPLTFLRSIAEFVAMERFRRRQLPRMKSLGAHDEPSDEAGPSEVAEWRDLLDRVERVIKQFGRADARCLVQQLRPIVGEMYDKGWTRRLTSPGVLERLIESLRELDTPRLRR